MKEKLKNNVGAGDSARPQKRNTQKGITLIALIISIIVMLILAVVSINIIINQGIIDKTQDAANTHKIAAEKEAIELAYSKYLTEKYNGETATLTIADSNATVTGNEESGWTITYANGNVYTLSKNGGIEGPTKNGGTTESPYVTPRTEVTYKGQTLKVGDYVNYDEGTGYTWTTDSTKGTGGDSNRTEKTYTTENMSWRVLGLDANGNLELISDKQTSEDLWLYGKTGYYNGEEQLNEMCDTLYGKGTNAKSARSLNAEDINAILGYNKRGFRYEGIGSTVADCEMNIRYGFRTTYYATRTTWEPEDTFIMEDGSNEYERIIEGCNGTEYIPFINIDGTVATDEAPITIESNVYSYERSELEDKVDSNILEMIFGKDMGCGGQNYFWLASRYVVAGCGFACWGLFSIDGDDLDSNFLYYSYGDEDYDHMYVRPVVSLKSDVQLSGNSETGWTIQQ